MPNPSKVALITGASRGLGRAMATAFANRGYAVGINYHANEAEAKKTAEEVRKLGQEAILFKADVSSSEAVNEMVGEIGKKWGRVDVLVNNAGNTRNRTIAKMSDEEWRDVMAANLDGPFFLTRAVLPFMRKQNGGSVINVISYLAKRGSRGAANYAAAKAGLLSLTQSTAIEEGRNNIRVNAIMPGFHPTDLNTAYWEKYEDQIRGEHLLPTMHNRGEMSAFVVTIAELTTVTGQVFSFESRIV